MANCFTATDELFTSLDVVDAVAATLLHPSALAPARLPVTNAISCATVVLISGYFESFLKDIANQTISGLNALHKPATSFPAAMKIKHFQSGAKALKWALKEDKKANSTSTSDDLMRRLGSLSNGTNCELAWEAFGDTNSNPGPDVVKDILSGLQVVEAWSEINGLSTAHGQLNTFLETFIRIRNVCAHTGSHSSPPTGQHLLEYTEKFRVIAECIDVLLGVQHEVYKTWP